MQDLAHRLYNHIRMKTIDQYIKEIQNLKIQGATNVALSVLDAIELTLLNSPSMPLNELKHIGVRLAYARPTEPLAQNALRYIFSEQNTPLLPKLKQYRTLIEQAKIQIPQHGKKILTDGGVYLTLCHSSTTVSLFETARKEGTYFSVYVAETRPRFQGRITATELLDRGFDDVTMIIDDVAVSLIEGRKGKIDAVFIGADLLESTGFVNKVGSLAVAAASNDKHIPVYVLSTLLKYDPRPFLPSMIEQRSSDEIWKEAPKTLKFYSPAFDFVPYFPNVHIISEAGIIEGTKVQECAKQLFPFVFSNKHPA